MSGTISAEARLLVEFEQVLRDYRAACRDLELKSQSENPATRSVAYHREAALNEQLLDMYAKALMRTA